MEEQRLIIRTIMQDLGDGTSSTFSCLSESYKFAQMHSRDKDYMQDEGSYMVRYKGVVNVESIIGRDPVLLYNTYIDYIKVCKDAGKSWEESDSEWTKLHTTYKNDHYYRYVKSIKNHIDNPDEEDISACGISHFRTFDKFSTDTKMWLVTNYNINFGILKDIIKAYDDFDIDLFFELGLEFSEMLASFKNSDYMKLARPNSKLAENPKAVDMYKDLTNLNKLRDLGKVIPFMHETKLRKHYEDLYNSM